MYIVDWYKSEVNVVYIKLFISAIKFNIINSNIINFISMPRSDENFLKII